MCWERENTKLNMELFYCPVRIFLLLNRSKTNWGQERQAFFFYHTAQRSCGIQLMRREIKSSPISESPHHPGLEFCWKAEQWPADFTSSMPTRVPCQSLFMTLHTLPRHTLSHLTQASHVQVVCASRFLTTRITLDHATCGQIPSLRIDAHQLFVFHWYYIDKVAAN